MIEDELICVIFYFFFSKFFNLILTIGNQTLVQLSISLVTHSISLDEACNKWILITCLNKDQLFCMVV